MELSRLNIKSNVPNSFQDQSSKKTFKQNVWLDTSHPNFERWKRGREVSIHRGQFVFDLLGNYSDCENLKVLDLGSGLGGTSKIFSNKNLVVSYEIDPFRLKNQLESSNEYTLINGDALNFPFKEYSFDIIILQDVIEHLPEINKLKEDLFKILKEDGIIYISTPNKCSVFNIISDPHWGLPLISFLKRNNIRKYFLKYFRKSDLYRKDIAQLFLLQDLQKAFEDKFNLKLNTRFAVQKLFEGHKGIIWSSFHLFLLKLILALKFDKLIIKISNDKYGLLNKYFTPTFYLILRKKI